MSQLQPDARLAEAMTRSRSLGTGRLARLTLKEMRETLRDRRTLITLVLMPFFALSAIKPHSAEVFDHGCSGGSHSNIPCRISIGRGSSARYDVD